MERRPINLVGFFLAVFVVICMGLWALESTFQDTAKIKFGPELVKERKTKYNVSICSMFKNEGRFLKEWIEFHRLAGVEHFYLYNNNSEDDYLAILSPYIAEGVVTLKQWQEQGQTPQGHASVQARAMEDCLTSSSSRWIAFLDIDEFFFPTQVETLGECLKEFDNNSSLAGLYVSWKMFGTSYVDEIPKDQVMIETLVRCEEEGYPLGKTVLRPERVTGFSDCHRPIPRKGYHFNFTDGFRSKNWVENHFTYEKLRINHYWSRDRKYLALKAQRSNVLEHVKNREWVQSFDQEHFNKIVDTSILRYVPNLRVKMGLTP